jgi:MFS family permease
MSLWIRPCSCIPRVHESRSAVASARTGTQNKRVTEIAPSAVPVNTAWAVFALLAIVMYGNFYVYDSIGPVADLLQRQRGFDSTQIGMLNAIYNLPNVVLLLVGGVLIDRYGAARVTLCTAAVCLVGAALTAFSPGFAGMAAGRLLFGTGNETFNNAMIVAIAEHFAGGNVALAMGLSIGFGRLGSFCADMSPTWFADGYRHGWQPPLMIATLFAAVSFAAAMGYWRLDRRIRGNRPVRGSDTAERFVCGDLLRFGSAYWYLLALCVLWYAVIFAFRSTFSIEYFQHAHGLDLAAAGAMNSYVFLAALFTTPAFGWVCDRTGRYTPMLAFGALLLPLSIAVMALTHWSLWVGTVMIGVSFSMVPAVMWPLSSKLVAPARFGTALGLMSLVQNTGIAGANVVAGWLNDWTAASAQNPAGYQPMMLFFGTLSTLGFGFALLLWFTARRRQQEALLAV